MRVPSYLVEIVDQHKGAIPREIILGVMAQESQMNSPKYQYRYEPHLARRNWPDSLYAFTSVPERLFASYGAMQLVYAFMVSDHKFEGYPEALYIPEINLPLGIKHLQAKLKLARGNLDLALTLYNGSPKNPHARAYPSKVRSWIPKLVLD